MSHSRSGGPIRTGYQTQPQNTGSHASSHGSAPSKAKVPIQYSALEMKRKLTAMLDKEKCEIYLRILGQMLTGDLPKADFDKQIKLLLNEEQRKLHNLFVITLLRSAYGSIATTNTQRRNVKVVPLAPRLGVGSRELAKQPVWSKIKAKMSAAAVSQGLTVDNEAVSAVMIGLEHHLKSIMCVAQPTQRLPQRIMVSPIIQHLAKLEHKEILDMTKKGDITAKNVCAALRIIPNVFERKRINFDDDVNFYHVQNHFAHMHHVNFEVAKHEKYQRRQEEEIEDKNQERNSVLRLQLPQQKQQPQQQQVKETEEQLPQLPQKQPQQIAEEDTKIEVLEDMEPQFNNNNENNNNNNNNNNNHVHTNNNNNHIQTDNNNNHIQTDNNNNHIQTNNTDPTPTPPTIINDSPSTIQKQVQKPVAAKASPLNNSASKRKAAVKK